MRKATKNSPTYSEINAALQDAADQVTAMVRYETQAAKAMEENGNPSDRLEYERCFIREYRAFTASTRSARDYMKAAARKAGDGPWFDSRLKKPGATILFEFHRCLANQTLHIYGIRLTPRAKTVQFVGAPDSAIIAGPGGPMPNKMIVTGTKDAIYHFDLIGLEENTDKAYQEVKEIYADHGIVALSLRYLDELNQMLKNAQRNGRFDRVGS